VTSQTLVVTTIILFVCSKNGIEWKTQNDGLKNQSAALQIKQADEKE